LYTHIVIKALRDNWDVNHLGTEILFDFSNKKVYILSSVEGAVAVADQGKQLLVIKVSVI
jgi:hypothetical protein